MKFQQFISGAVASDGGTISCRAVMDDGRVLECGLDARVPIAKANRMIFVGAAYSTLPDARLLGRYSGEETDFIEALLDLVGRAPGDEVAGMLLRAILDR